VWSFLQSLAALLSVHAGTLLGGTVLPIILTRFLGAEALGIFTFAASFGLLLLTIIDWGYETRLPLLSASAPESALELVSQAQAAKFRLWYIALLCIILLYAAYFLVPVALFQSTPLQSTSLHNTSSQTTLLTIAPLALYAAWAIARGMTMTYSAVLRGLQRFGAIARVENIGTLSSHGAAVLLVMIAVAKNDNLHGTMPPEQVVMLLCGIIMCFVAGEAAKFFALRKELQEQEHNRSASSKAASTQVRSTFGIPLTWSHLVFVMMQATAIVQSRAGIYALMLLSTPLEIGIAGAVMRFTIAMRLLPGALFHVLLPHFVRSPKRETLGKALAIGLVIGLAGSGGLFIAAEWLIGLVYGAKFLHLAPLLRIAAWIFCLQTLGQVLESYLLARQKERAVNWAMFLCLCSFAAVCVSLTVMTAEIAIWSSLVLESALLLVFGGIILADKPQQENQNSL
jgi:O-antigen/teichoic acid export membrane protein